jgi:hypothetical protein
VTPAEADERAVAREHPPAAADALVRALATLRRAGGASDAGRLHLPADLPLFPPDLWAPLSVIHHLDDGRRPARDGRLANALRRIARWAAGAGASGTALAFAEASAALHTALPSPALLAAWAAFDAGRTADARRWLAEAMARAAHACDLAAGHPAASASTCAERWWADDVPRLDRGAEEAALPNRAAAVA